MHSHEHDHVPGGVQRRQFALRGGLADGAKFNISTCEHGGWPELVLGPKPGTSGPELRYGFDSKSGQYVYIGQTETFDGD